MADLEKLLMSRLEFGTAGLRARMGPGNSQMNDLTIIQTTQGLLKYLQQMFPDYRKQGVIIGYDARHNSKKWATITANIFLNDAIKVYLFSEEAPTPFVPFGILHFKCCAGIVITASHNPKEDNGYKLYFANGSQIISPHDKNIARLIEENLEPRASSWNTDLSSFAQRAPPLLIDPLREIEQTYYATQKAALLVNLPESENKRIKIVYTAMHGVGWKFAREMLRHAGFTEVVPVAQQVAPDPEFPTVRYPNPEEGKSALNLAVETANATPECRLILANDPDADRLAVAEKLDDTNNAAGGGGGGGEDRGGGGGWKILNGNELGNLIGWWLWKKYAETENPAEKCAKNSDAFMLASTVSSKFLRAMAAAEGFTFEETLTGFKWMGNRAQQIEEEGGAGRRVLFCFEEAIGYMCGSSVRDKDGISAAAVVAEAASWLRNRAGGRGLTQQLHALYTQYGYHATRNGYFISHDKRTIRGIFERLRHWDEFESEKETQRDAERPLSYPKSCGHFAIRHVRDLTSGYDSSQLNLRCVLPTSKSSQMITFSFENECVVTMRTSGTEPKIKFYSEMCASPSSDKKWSELDEELNQLIGCVIEHFYRPTLNNLVAQSD